MKKFIQFFIENGKLVNLGILLFFFFGIVATKQLNSSFFPKVPDTIIYVQATYPGASPLEVEEGITQKIEENLKSVSGLEKVTSSSIENSCTVTVEIKLDQDIDQILQEVKNSVDQISSFPAGMEKIQVYKRENLNNTVRMILKGKTSLLNLKETAEKVEDDLRAFSELSNITSSGYTSEEIEIEVKEETLRSLELTFTEVVQAIQQHNIKISGGTIKGDLEYQIRADNKRYNATELESIPIRQSANGSWVTLGDVADVHEDWSENTDAVTYDGEPVIFFDIATLNNEDILKAAVFVNEYVEKFNQQNTVIKAEILDDRTEMLNDRINLLVKNGLMGLVLVLFLLSLFLRVRISFWVALGIPVSFLGMIVMALMFGVTINALSLFGMILVVGILVDDGIVVAENVFQKYEQGYTPIKAAVEGTIEVFPSICSAIATTVVAFSIFFFIEGRLGNFFQDIAFVVIWALIFSLVEVVLFLPAHLAHSKDLNKDFKTSKIKKTIEQGLFKFRDKFFIPILNFALAYKIFFLCLSFSILLLSFAMVKWRVVKSTFFPKIEARSISVTLETPPGTSAKITAGLFQIVQERADKLNKKYEEDPEVGKPMFVGTQVRYGTSSNVAGGRFFLVDSEDRSLRSDQILSDLREAVGKVVGTEKLSFETSTPFGRPINVSLSSNDFVTLNMAVKDFMKTLEDTDMFSDIVNNANADIPEIDVKLKHKAKVLGLTESDIMGQIRMGFFGVEAQRLQRGNDEVKVWVRYAKEDRSKLENLRNMRIRIKGGVYPLSELAELKESSGYLTINHREGHREVTITAALNDKKGITTTEAIPYVQNELIPSLLKKYPDIKIFYGGQQRLRDKTVNSIKSAGGIILVIMISLLVISFRSYSQTFALCAIVPFGFIGVIFGHWLHGHAISLLSMLGFVALMGVILNDGIVFVNSFNTYLKEGVLFDEALKKTTRTRFRPILLTTLTTSIGLLPLILETSFQAQFLIPMGITIAYGLLAGSFFVTVLLPVVLSLINWIKVYAEYLWEGKKPTKESVECAIIRKNENESIN